MEMYLTACSVVTTLSAFVIGGVAINKYIHRFEPVSTEMVFLDGSREMAGISESDAIFFTIGLFAICVMFRVIMHKYPLRIYRYGTK